MVKIYIEELNKRFSYEFDEGKTIFILYSIFKFFTTIAVKWAILSEIRKGMAVVDGDFLQIRPQALEEGCRVANAIIRERDDHLRVLTKQEKCFRVIKKFIQEYKRDFFYHRDLQRRFSSYSPACLSAVITRLIEDNSIEKRFNATSLLRALVSFQADKSSSETKDNIYDYEKVFPAGSRIYYVILMPEKVQSRYLYIQVVKKDNDYGQFGYKLVWTRDVRLKDEELNYFTDYFVLHEDGYYFMKVYSKDNPHKVLTAAEFSVTK